MTGRFLANLKSVIVLSAFMLVPACKQVKTELPAILRDHKDRAAFTKLGDRNNAFVDLFNGKDLTGWYSFTPKYGRNNDEEKAFKVTDGALHFCRRKHGLYLYKQFLQKLLLAGCFSLGREKVSASGKFRTGQRRLVSFSFGR